MKKKYKSPTFNCKWSSSTPLLRGYGKKAEVISFTCGCRYTHLTSWAFSNVTAGHFVYFPLIRAPRNSRQSPFSVPKSRFEQGVMEGSCHRVAALRERASPRPRNGKKEEKENWRLLNFVSRKLGEVQTCEISSRWERHNFSYKPKIECSGSPALWANHSKSQRWLVTRQTHSGLHSFRHWNVVLQLPKIHLPSGDMQRERERRETCHPKGLVNYFPLK